jgi:hypothetical protein
VGLFFSKKGLRVGNLFVFAAVMVSAPVIVSVLGPIMRPVAKAAVKRGIRLYESGRGLARKTREAFGDLVEEARTEMALELERRPQPPTNPLVTTMDEEPMSVISRR